MPFRFWDRVLIGDRCWAREGAHNAHGYPVFALTSAKTQLAHRVAWELVHGPIPPGMYVCHHCDNPGCVRPDHLFLGTQADNMADCAAKGRAHSPHTAKTHCPQGHPYDEENTRQAGHHRICRACERKRALAYYHRNKAV